jgi:hypothetical protein
MDRLKETVYLTLRRLVRFDQLYAQQIM